MSISENSCLIDEDRNVVAYLHVAQDGEWLAGEVDLAPMPTPLRQLFEEFEEIVDGQMFSFLDDIEWRISALGLGVLSRDGEVRPVEDLQIHPASGAVRFKVAHRAIPPVAPRESATR